MEIQRWVQENLCPFVLVIEHEQSAKKIKAHSGASTVDLLNPFCDLQCYTDFIQRLFDKRVDIEHDSAATSKRHNELCFKLFNSNSQINNNLDRTVASLHEKYSQPWFSRLEEAQKKNTGTGIQFNKHECNHLASLEDVSFGNRRKLPDLSDPTSDYSLESEPYSPFFDLMVDTWLRELAACSSLLNPEPIGLLFVVTPSENVCEEVQLLRANCKTNYEGALARLILVADIGNEEDACDKAVLKLQEQYPPETCHGIVLRLDDDGCLTADTLRALEYAVQKWIADCCRNVLDIQGRNLDFHVKHFRRGFRNQMRSYLGLGAWHAASIVKGKSSETDEQPMGAPPELDGVNTPLTKAQAHCSLGNTHFWLQSYEKALQHYKQALSEAKFDKMPNHGILLGLGLTTILSGLKSEPLLIQDSEPAFLRDGFGYLSPLLQIQNQKDSFTSNSLSIRFVIIKLLVMAGKAIVINFETNNEALRLKTALKYFETAFRRMTEIYHAIDKLKQEEDLQSSYEQMNLESIQSIQNAKSIAQGDLLLGMIQTLNCLGALLSAFSIVTDPDKCINTEDLTLLREKLGILLNQNFPDKSALKSDQICCYLNSPTEVFKPYHHTKRTTRNRIHLLFRAAHCYRIGGEHRWADMLFRQLEKSLVTLGSNNNFLKLKRFVSPRDGLGQWSAALATLMELAPHDCQHRLILQLLQAISYRQTSDPEHDYEMLTSLKMIPNRKHMSICFPLLVPTNWLLKQEYYDWYSRLNLNDGKNAADALKTEIQRIIHMLPQNSVAIALESNSIWYKRKTTEKAARRVDLGWFSSFESCLSKENSKLASKGHQLDLMAVRQEPSSSRHLFMARPHDTTSRDPVKIHLVLWNPLEIGIDIDRIYVTAVNRHKRDVKIVSTVKSCRIESRSVNHVTVYFSDCMEGVWDLFSVAITLEAYELDMEEQIYYPTIANNQEEEEDQIEPPLRFYVDVWGSTRLRFERDRPISFTVWDPSVDIGLRVKLSRTHITFPTDLILGEIVECFVEWNSCQSLSTLMLTTKGILLYDQNDKDKAKDNRLHWKHVTSPVSFTIFANKPGDYSMRLLAVTNSPDIDVFGVDLYGCVERAASTQAARIENTEIITFTVGSENHNSTNDSVEVNTMLLLGSKYGIYHLVDQFHETLLSGEWYSGIFNLKETHGSLLGEARLINDVLTSQETTNLLRVIDQLLLFVENGRSAHKATFIVAHNFCVHPLGRRFYMLSSIDNSLFS